MSSAKALLFQNSEYLQIYQELHGLTRENKTSQPFIPLVPKDWDAAGSNKIMWCGGATNGWDEGERPDVFDFHATNRANEEWLRDDFSKRGSTDFWRIQRLCLQEIHTDWDHTIWNNIFKVGGVEKAARGVPSKALQQSQGQLCVRAFEIELEILQPKLVVLHVGELTNEIMHLITGPWNNWKVHKVSGNDMAAYKVHNGVDLIWLSRRYAETKDYLDSFQWCLNGLEAMKL